MEAPASVDPAPVRILFIGGYARTGSTLLDRILGGVDGFASFGELRHVWERCFLGDQLCGCGERFRSCPFWTAVAGRAFGGFDGIDAAAVRADQRAVDALWQVPLMLAGGGPQVYRRRFLRYRGAVEGLYRAIAATSGARFLVDSTKDPQHAYLLSTIPGFDVRILHLVRDSRAVAHSWRRQKRRPEIHWREQDMPRFPVWRSALAWDVTNLSMHGLRLRRLPYAVLRYEDLMCRPEDELRRVLVELETDPPDEAMTEDGRVRLGVAHTVAGNPVRFGSGPVQLRLDEEWRTAMPPAGRAMATTLSLPGLVAYGYLRPSSVGARRKTSSPPGPTAGEMVRILRLALRSRSEPVAYSRAVAGLAIRYLRHANVRLDGSRALDVGAGSGGLADALVRAGARTVAIDLSDRRDRRLATSGFAVARGERLPFADGAFDVVVCSNVLEHVPDGPRLVAELFRVCRPGGSVWLSWTNWLSPLGGHEWSPFHYLGPRVGPAVYEAVRGRPVPWNAPGENLFPVHVGGVLRSLRRSDVQVLDVVPRYWPRLRWIAGIPGVREFAMWNCAILMRAPSPG